MTIQLNILFVLIVLFGCNRTLSPVDDIIPVNNDPSSSLGIRFMDTLRTQLVCLDCKYLSLIRQSDEVKEIYVFDGKCKMPSSFDEGLFRNLESFVSYSKLKPESSVFTEANKLKYFSMPNCWLDELPTTLLSNVRLRNLFVNLSSGSDLNTRIGFTDSLQELSIVVKSEEEISGLENFKMLHSLSLLSKSKSNGINIASLDKLSVLSQLAVDTDLNAFLEAIVKCDSIEYLKVNSISDLEECLPVLRSLENLKAITVDKLSLEDRLKLSEIIPVIEGFRWPDIR